MSPDELVATEVRRLDREAEEAKCQMIEAVFEPPGGGIDTATTKDVTVKLEAAISPRPQYLLRFSHASSFHEAIILTSTVFRSIAGGFDSQAASGPQDRFVISEGGTGRVSVDRLALVEILKRECGASIAQALRLVASEMRSLTAARLSTDERIALFEDQWQVEDLRQRVEAVVATLATRVLMKAAGKDHVALWVRKADFSGATSILASALAPALVRPTTKPIRLVAFPFKEAGANEHDAAYLQWTSGAGPERTVVIDITNLSAALLPLSDEQRDESLLRLSDLVARSCVIAQERLKRNSDRLSED